MYRVGGAHTGLQEESRSSRFLLSREESKPSKLLLGREEELRNLEIVLPQTPKIYCLKNLDIFFILGACLVKWGQGV